MPAVTPSPHGTRNRVRAREVEDAQEARAEAARARRRVQPRTPVVHDIPTTVRIVFIRTVEGSGSGSTKQHGITATWDVDFDNFCTLLTPEEESLREGMPRGSWEAERTGEVFE